MTVTELKEMAIREGMTVSKIFQGVGYRGKYIWDDAHEHILAKKKTPYNRYMYLCHAKGNDSEGYRITKNLYEELSKIL